MVHGVEVGMNQTTILNMQDSRDEDIDADFIAVNEAEIDALLEDLASTLDRYCSISIGPTGAPCPANSAYSWAASAIRS
jgi:hypothetical protein